MKTKIAGVSLLVAIIASALSFGLQPIQFKTDVFGEVLPLLGVLFTISLFIERALEVFQTVWRGGSADIQDLELADTREKIEKLENSGSDAATLEALQKQYKALQENRTLHRNQSREIALWTGLLIGVVVSAAGVRMLVMLMDPTAVTLLPAEQRSLLSTVDILLTGSMLAGGSAAVNKLMKVYENFMKNSATHAPKK